MVFKLSRVLMLFSVVGILWAPQVVEAKKSKFTVRFGLMTGAQGSAPYVFDEARIIERYGDGSDAHGFTISKRGGGRFMLHYAVTFPEPIDLPDAFLQKGRMSPDKKKFTLDSEMVWDQTFQVFFFSEDDPLGMYKMEVFVDDALLKTYDYEVIDPNAGFGGF
ncbi:MAG: hypothetical protein AAGB46_17300 [Verrucomicrobiota bacterium]